MHLHTEIDGLRVFTNKNTYFLSIVDDSIVDTFGLGSVTPSAMLHEAQKQMDF
jgi:hypothetical protein